MRLLYVFNNLTKQCIEGTLPATARVGEGYDELICAQFLVPSDKDECAYYNEISALMRAFNRKKGIKSYTILPTFRCNARCIYCYEEGVTQTTMTPETVEQVIRFIVSTHAGKKAKITWFGGEPLLGEGIIDRICEGLREAGFRSSSSKGGVRLKFRNNYCMADGGGVVITPDGTLAACEHCPKESQFGDIWHGTTDEEAKKEFCRADRTREKCRTCPFLPDCTSFAFCPLYNTHCRQVNEMLAMDSLKRMVEHREENSGDDSAC